MRTSKLFTLFLALILSSSLTVPNSLMAQNDVNGFFDQQFSNASRVLQLAEVIPADNFSWRPMEGVRSIGEVYLHIAQANYAMLGAMGVSSPEGLNLEAIDPNNKQSVIDAFSESIDFVSSSVEGLSQSTLGDMHELFGQTMQGEHVLIFLLNHMSEHVGQLIAYARTNNVVPPWSE